jgi:hypothetical protein
MTERRASKVLSFSGCQQATAQDRGTIILLFFWQHRVLRLLTGYQPHSNHIAHRAVSLVNHLTTAGMQSSY